MIAVWNGIVGRHADGDADRQSGGDLCRFALQADESLVKAESLFQDHG